MVKKKFNPSSLFKGKESFKEELNEAKAIKSGKITPREYAMGEKKEDNPKMKKFAAGGQVARGSGCAVKGNSFTKNG